MWKIIMSLLLLLLSVSTVHAEVYVAPSTGDPYTGYQSIANLLGNLAITAQQNALEQKQAEYDARLREQQERQYEETLSMVRNQISDIANNIADNLSNYIRQYGVEATFNYLEQESYKQGIQYERYVRDGISFYTTVVTPTPDAPGYWEYSYNPQLQMFRVIGTIPAYSIREVATRDNVIQMRQTSRQNAPVLSGYRRRLIKPNDAKTLMEYLFGAEISARKENFKNSSGYRVITVDRSGIFDFNKIQKGDIIVGIGNNSLRDVKNLDELGAIINAVPVGSVTQLSVIRNGEKKIIPFKMYDPRECITE